MSLKITNPIWNYFEKADSKAKCKTCSRSLSLGSNIPKKQSVSNIKNHLQKCHIEEWDDYLELVNSSKKNSKSEAIKLETSVASHDKTVGNATFQITLPEICERKSQTLWPDDHHISRRIDKSIMDMIIVDMLPYTIVDSIAFKRLNFSDPAGPSKYRKKSEKFFRTTLMPATYEKVEHKVRNLISKAEWISFTTDIWSNPTKSCSLLSFTAHFIVGSKRLKVILGAMVLDEDHTGSVIANKLQELTRRFGIEQNIHLAIRDNAANMNAATRIANYTALGCVAHTLQLVIHDSIFKVRDVECLIKKCRKLVGHFKKSEQANRYLHKFQEICSLPKHTLLQDIETRWNSTYLMMDRLNEQKRAINLYMAERGSIDIPSVDEWELIQNLIFVLKPFYQATLDISSDTACVSVIIPLIAMLNLKLQSRDEDNTNIASLKQNLCCSLNKRFAFIRNFQQLLVATLLDPRFKTKYLTLDQIDFAKKELIDFLQKRHIQNVESTNVSTSVSVDIAISSTSQNCGVQCESIENDNLWDFHDINDTVEINDKHDNQSAAFPSFDDCLNSYLKEPLLLRNADIFSYWDSSPHQLLRPAVNKYLSAPPTSVASEQLFSLAGQLYADRRANLLGENAEKLLFLALNIKLFNFEY